MQTLPQTVASSDLKVNPNSVFTKAANGPVLILSRATPKAVVVSPEVWNATAKRLEYLERQYLCDQLSREMDVDPAQSIPFTEAELRVRGLIDG